MMFSTLPVFRSSTSSLPPGHVAAVVHDLAHAAGDVDVRHRALRRRPPCAGARRRRSWSSRWATASSGLGVAARHHPAQSRAAAAQFVGLGQASTTHLELLLTTAADPDGVSPRRAGIRPDRKWPKLGSARLDYEGKAPAGGITLGARDPRERLIEPGAASEATYIGTVVGTGACSPTPSSTTPRARRPPSLKTA